MTGDPLERLRAVTIGEVERRDIVLIEHDEAWHERFSVESARIRDRLGDGALRVEPDASEVEFTARGIRIYGTAEEPTERVGMVGPRPPHARHPDRVMELEHPRRAHSLRRSAAPPVHARGVPPAMTR